MTVVGTATIKIIPNTAGFSAALQGQLKGVGTAFNNSLGGSGGALSSFNQRLSGISDSLGKMSQKMILTGSAMTYSLSRPLVELGSTVVETAAKFDESMHVIQAVSKMDLSNPTAVKNLKEIHDFAIELGRVGRFSANDIAAAFESIARSGADVGGTGEAVATRIKALGNVMREVATVERTDMTTATDLLVNVFTGFGGSLRDAEHNVVNFGTALKGGDNSLAAQMQRVGDVIAEVSANSVNSITDLANAFKYAGPVANAAGLSFQETAAALGVIGEAGFKATVGGTALRGIITRLTAATDQSKAELQKLGFSADQAFGPDVQENIAMTADEIDQMTVGLRKAGADGKTIDEILKSLQKKDFVNTAADMKEQVQKLGFELFDTTGKLKPLSVIMPMFAKKLADGTMRIGDVMKLLGQRAGPAFIALLEQQGLFNTLSQNVNNADGTLEKMSKTIEESATVQLARLKNAFVELAIKIGESGVLGFFADMATNLTDFVHKMSDSDPEIFKWIGIVGALVAAMGPLKIIIGLIGAGLNSFLIKPLMMLTSPMGLVSVGIGAIVGMFALMVNKSEDLRKALGYLWDVLKAVGIPMIKAFGGFVMGLVGAASEAAKWLGDKLAPAIEGIAKSIKGWADNNGIANFLNGLVHGFQDAAMGAYDFHKKLSELGDGGVFHAMGDAVDRIKNDLGKLGEDLRPIWDHLGEALRTIGQNAGTAAAGGLAALWKMGALVLSVIEKLLDVAKPFISFLGDHLATVLGIVAARFLLVRDNAMTAIPGFAQVGRVAEGVTTSIANGAYYAAGAVASMGRGFNNAAQEIANRSSVNLTRPALLLSKLGDTVETVSDKVSWAIGKLGQGIRAAGQIISGVFQNAMLPLMGFFSGQMVGQAKSLTDAIGGAIPVIYALGTAAKIANPYVALLTMAITVGTFAYGALTGKTKDAINATINFSQAVDDVAQSMENTNGSVNGAQFLKIFTQELDKLSVDSVTNFSQTLKSLGHDMGDLGKAFGDGSGSATKWIDNIRNEWVAANLTDKLHDFDIMAEKVVKDQNGRIIGGGEMFKIDGSQIEEATKALGDFSGHLEIVDKHNPDHVLKTFKSMEDVLNYMRDTFNTSLGGNAVMDFDKAIAAGVDKWKAMKPVMDAAKLAEGEIASLQKDYVDRIRDANDALDVTRNKLKLLSHPQETVAESTSAFIKDQIEAAKALQSSLGALSASRPGGLGAMTPQAADWDKFTQGLTNAWQDVVATAMKDMPAGLSGEEFQRVLNDKLSASRGAFRTALIGMGVDAKEADDLIAKYLTTEAAKLNDEALSSFDKFKDSAQAKALVAKTSFDDLKLKAYYDLIPRMAKASSLDPDVRELLQEVFVSKGTPTKDIDLILNSYMNAPAGFDLKKFTAMLAFGQVNPIDITATMSLMSTTGVSIDAISKLVAGGVINAGQIVSTLSIVPQFAQIPGVSPDEQAAIIANMIGKGASMNEISQTMQLITQASLSDPEGIKKILDMVAASNGKIPATEIPVMLKMQAEGIDMSKLGLDSNGNLDLDKLALEIMYYMAPEVHHEGGIVGKVSPEGRAKVSKLQPNERLSLLEIGEAVIPKDVVDKFGSQFFEQLMSGALPTALLQFQIVIDFMSQGTDMVLQDAQSMEQTLITSMLDTAAAIVAAFQDAFAQVFIGLTVLQVQFLASSLTIVSYIDLIVSALNRIPDVMAGIGRAMANGFRDPIAFIGNSVWGPFATMLNSAAAAFGIGISLPTGFKVPTYHTGGLVGEDGSMTGGPLGQDEIIAKLQRGEGVMTQEMMASMTAAQLHEFRRGNPLWYAVGGPYEAGSSWVNDRKDQVGSKINNYDADAMRSTYEGTIKPMLEAIKSTVQGNISATAMETIAEGAIQFVQGADKAIQEEMMRRIPGLPADFDMKGVIPDGFDLMGWREFLAANKASGDWPLLPKYLDALGVPYLINSTFRPGGHSYHASGRAVDFGAPNDANYDSPGLLRIDRAFAPLLGVLSELIYYGPGGIRDKEYDADTAAQHHNHVHAALANGALINELVYAMLGESGPEVVIPLNRPSRAMDLAIQSGLFGVLNEAARARNMNYVSAGSAGRGTYTGTVPSTASTSTTTQQFDGGILGGGPGNTYIIQGAELPQVRAEIRNRDAATMRKRR